jgi:AcrR family transcriptional regulator
MPLSRPHTSTKAPAPNRGDRQNARGEATRELILLTAERLFAERGIAAVPLRDIGAAAGQRNNVAVQYHFGDRETLVLAVNAYRVSVMDEIARVFETGFDRGNPPTIEAVVHAFVAALARNIEDDNHYLQFLLRYMVERGGYEGLMETVPRQAADRWGGALREMLPHLPDRVLGERWHVLCVAAVHTLARYQTSLQEGTLRQPLGSLVDDLAQMLAAALAAPLAPPAHD